MTTKQEYRPVTTKEGIVLLVDENVFRKEGDYVFDTFINACPQIRILTTTEEADAKG